MSDVSRRFFLGAMASFPAFGSVSRVAPRPTDIRIEDVSLEFEDFLYRTPNKFGGSIVDRVTLLNVRCVVRTEDGRTGRGFGSMTMGNVWSFPSRTMPYSATLNAMKELAQKVRKITADYRGVGHPIDIHRDLEPEYHKAADEVSKRKGLALDVPIPKLCTQVTASPFDAAIHDAFGKIHGRNCYATYGPEFMSHDVAYYLGPEFRGEFLSAYLSERPKPRMPMYHTIGAVDPIVVADIQKRVDDGLPETLAEWIPYNGLTHFKIKLNGEDLEWDVDRIVRIHDTTAQVQKKRGVADWVYSLDFNEKAPSIAYLLDFLRVLKEKTPEGFRRLQYVEQPTARDLHAVPPDAMREAARLLPVVADESLTDYESLLLAREKGYSGVAIKACKGQSHAVLLAVAAQKFRMFLCVQDLTCPGASLIHSAGLSAHVPAARAIEANARQYVPAANKGWESKYPGIFIVKDGMMDTSGLDKPGLGAVDP